MRLIPSLGKAMRRRDLVKGIVGSTVGWPLAARAQQGERVRRIGVLMDLAENSGRTGPQNGVRTGAAAIRLDRRPQRPHRIRWGTDACNTRRYVAELVALAPDVIVAAGSAAMAASQQTTRTVPIVFMHVVDPVAAVSSRAYRGWAATPPGSCPTGAGAAGTSPPVDRRGSRGWVSP